MAPEGARPQRLLPRLARLAVKALLVLVAIAAVAWLAARPSTPDAFYDHPLPQGAVAGTLVASAPHDIAIPPGAQGWRILYVTMRGGRPALASAVVVAPPPAAGVTAPVIAWAHGTTGIATGCAPSMVQKSFRNMPNLDVIIGMGWAYVGTDYPGLGTAGPHTYLIGEDAAHAVLDAVRAARQLQGAGLGDQVVVWGHSQGGNSALWTGVRGHQIAPELQIRGIAALAPASDLKGLITAIKTSMFGKIISSYLVIAYAEAYRDVKVDDYVGGLSRLVVADIATRCFGGYETLFSMLETRLLPAAGIFATDPTSGPLGVRLAQNTPTGMIPAPVLIAQGKADDLVDPQVQQRYVRAQCAAGQPIEYRIYPDRGHVTLLAPDSPLAADLIEWTRDRFDGKPASDNCGA